MPKTQKTKIPVGKWLADIGRSTGRGVSGFFKGVDGTGVAIIGCVFALIGCLGFAAYQTIQRQSFEKYFDEKTSVIVNDRKYTLAGEHRVSTAIDDYVTAYYDFESRVKITITDLEPGDYDYVFSSIRFEDLESPYAAEDARRAGLEISQNIRGAFDGATDKKFIDDMEQRAKISKLAEDFWAAYGAEEIRKQDGVGSGVDKNAPIVITESVTATPLKMEN